MTTQELKDRITIHRKGYGTYKVAIGYVQRCIAGTI